MNSHLTFTQKKLTLLQPEFYFFSDGAASVLSRICTKRINYFVNSDDNNKQNHY